MTRIRHFRLLVPVLATVGLAACASLTLLTSPTAAFQVDDRGVAGLDGKVVMSPAAERIETIEPDGGEQIGPGSTVQRAVIIQNRTEAPITFDMDVAQVVGSSAELVVEVRHGVREGAAAWVTLEKTSFTLKPGQQGTMLVTIEVPTSVKPGSKPFAVTATQRSPQGQAQGAGIAPQFRQIGIFIIELPGDAPVKGSLTEASITSAQKGIAAARDGREPPKNSQLYIGPGLVDSHRLTLSAAYENNGERLIRPTGRVVIKDVFGRSSGTFELEDFTVYPGGEAAQTVELKGLPSLGLFTARVELESEPTGKQTTTLPRFLMIPKWFLIAVGAFLLYGLFKVVRWRLRRRRAWQAHLDQEDELASVPAGADEDDFDGETDAWEYDDEPERV